MKEIPLGPGVAPDVSIVNSHIYVAFGTQNPMALVLVVLRLDGVEVGRLTLPNGYDQSFPRFSGSWLVYRQDEAHNSAATAMHILTEKIWTYGPAGGTFGLTVNAVVGLLAYEWRDGDGPWRIRLGNLSTGEITTTTMEGAPDGLDRLLAANDVTLRKDTRGDVEGIWYPVDAGHLTVGELRDEPSRPNGGIGVQLWGDVLRVALPAQNTPNPRCATDGTVYAIVCWNPVRLLIATMAELRALRPVVDRQPGPVLQTVTRSSTPTTTIVSLPKERSVSLPSLDEWLHVELPQLVEAFHQTHPHTPTPDDWYAFQTWRRYGPELWSFEQMLRHEKGDDGPAPVNPQ